MQFILGWNASTVYVDNLCKYEDDPTIQSKVKSI